MSSNSNLIAGAALVLLALISGLAASFFLALGCGVENLEPGGPRDRYCQAVGSSAFLILLPLVGIAIVAMRAAAAVIHRRSLAQVIPTVLAVAGVELCLVVLVAALP